MLAVVWAAAASMLAGSAARADCGHEHVVVAEASTAEHEGVCRALADVVDYFVGLGFQVVPKARISFREEVYVEVFAPGSKQPSARQRVSGYYDAGRHIIELTSATTTTGVDRHPFRQAWSADISYSIARHEITHMVVGRLMGQRYAGLSRAWREYIASAVQFDLMEPGLRDRIMASYGSHLPFARAEHVNELTYGFDPDGFAISAFLHYRENGGKAFIAKILRGETDFPTGELYWSR